MKIFIERSPDNRETELIVKCSETPDSETEKLIAELERCGENTPCRAPYGLRSRKLKDAVHRAMSTAGVESCAKRRYGQ